MTRPSVYRSLNRLPGPSAGRSSTGGAAPPNGWVLGVADASRAARAGSASLPAFPLRTSIVDPFRRSRLAKISNHHAASSALRGQFTHESFTAPRMIGGPGRHRCGYPVCREGFVAARGAGQTGIRRAAWLRPAGCVAACGRIRHRPRARPDQSAGDQRVADLRSSWAPT